jgi:hypothetical protein
MKDKTEFSLDVTVNPASGFKPIPDLVAFDLCKAYPVPGGNLLLLNTRNAKRAVVRPEVYATLTRCTKFLSLDEHAKNIIALNPGMQGQQADIHQVLKTMLESGIMISAKNTCDSFKSKKDPQVSGKDSSNPVVVVITWERPAALERLFRSIKANCATEKFHHLYVVDDSRIEDNIQKNRDLTAQFAFEIDSPVQYFGQNEQQSLLASLSRQLPAHEDSLRFLADQSRWRDHWTSGLARNLALLLSCGRRLVMLDDDTICDVFEPGQLKPDISFSDGTRQADFFSSEQEWLSKRQPINPDPIARHMQCLGLTFSEALQVLGENNLKPVSLSNANALLVNDLHRSSPVLVTECGSLGCPGIGKNTWLPDMAPSSLNMMLSSTQKTTNALNTRMVWTGHNHPHFSPRPNMSQITGFDNRKMLPPYLPVLRGEDRLFGYFLDFIFPTSISLDYPWAIPHLPLPKREWSEEDRDFTSGPSFPLFFNELLPQQKFNCKAEHPKERLLALSAWYRDLANAPADSLSTSHQDFVLKDITEQLQNLTRLLEDSESTPKAWRDYLQHGLEQLGASLNAASREDFTVAGLPVTMEGDELIHFWKETWAGFSAALAAWPEIREAAEELLG